MKEIPEKLDQILAVLKSLDDKAKPVREIMGIPEAAEYLGQTEGTLRHWVRLRRIPYHKVNGSIKFRKSHLDLWINEHEIPVIDN